MRPLRTTDCTHTGTPCRARAGPPRSGAKTALITGCSTGIGFETACALCECGYRVIVHCRTEAKVEGTRARIRNRHPTAFTEGMAVDLSELRSLDRSLRSLLERIRRLDLLVNNAGAVFRKRTVTAEGLEGHFGVNYLAAFHLTRVLLPLLTRAPGSRIVNVSSVTHRIATVRFDDLQCQRRYHWLRGYANSKLAVLWLTYALARRLEASRVAVNAVDPGIVATNIFLKDGTVIKRWLGPFMRWVISGPRQGAEAQIHAATSPELEGVTGAYLVKGKRRESSKVSRDEGAGERLWAMSERILEEIL